MNRLSFTSYLRELDSRIIMNHLCAEKSSGVLGERTYESINTTYTSENSVSDRWNSLTRDQQHQLFLTYLAGDEGVVVGSDETVTELVRSFLVYEGHILAKRALFGFSDIAAILVPHFVELLGTKAEIGSQPLLFSGIAADSAILLSMIRHGDFKRRQDGILLKTSVDQFLAMAMLQPVAAQISPESSTFLIELLLRFLVSESIIRFTIDGYELTHDGELLWAQKVDSLADRFEIYSQTVLHIADTELISMLLKCDLALPIAEYTGKNEQVALAILVWCGKAVCQNGFWSRGNQCVVPPIETGHIMPDFTILFPREISSISLYSILQIAQIEQVDQLCRARISRELVSDSLARGVRSDSIVELLKKWNCSPHMIRTMEEWFYSFDRVFVDGNYLAINNRAGDFVAQHPEIESLLTPFSDYKFYRIIPEAQVEIKMRLEKMGFDSRMPFAPIPKPKAEHPKMIEMISKAIPEFNPELDRIEPVQTNFGKYGGALRSQTLVELLKIVRFAILMEEHIAVILVGETEPHTFMPIDVRTGENGAIIGRNDSNRTEEFRLDTIDKIGVVQN